MTLLPHATGNDAFSRAFNRLADEVRAQRLHVAAPLEMQRTPAGTLLALRGTASVTASVGTVLVIQASAAQAPTPFDTLAYAVTLIEDELSVPALTANPAADIYRVMPNFVRYGQRFDDGTGGQTPMLVLPARPGTFGEVRTFRIQAGGQTTETRVVSLYDEVPAYAGC